MKNYPDVLYHYTSVESLAMILSTKSFRLSPLSTLDDLQEEKTKDISQIGKTVFISSWSEDAQESIPMWNLYSDMESGVRIKAASEMFDPTIILRDKTIQITGNLYYNDESYLFPPELKKVIYTDDDNKIIPQIVSHDKQRWNQQLLGVYKSTVWEFQKEWRYIVRVWPGKNYEDENEDAEAIYNKFSKKVEPYICLKIMTQVRKEQ